MKELMEAYEEYLNLMGGAEPTFSEFMQWLSREYGYKR